MLSKFGGFVATLLLAIPLAAVPFMAVFGIPKVTPALQAAFPDLQNSSSQLGSPNDPRGWNDPNQPFAQTASVSTNDDAPTWGDTTEAGTPISAASPNSYDPLFPQGDRQQTSQAIRSSPVAMQTAEIAANTSAEPFTATPVVNPPTPSTSGLTWRQAVSELNRMGIQRFWLTAGAEPGEFEFACVYTPPENPSMTYRFSDSATEPLQAVQKVLAQISNEFSR